MEQINAIYTYQHTVNTEVSILHTKGMSLPGKCVVFFRNLKIKHLTKSSRRCFERLQSDASGQVIVLGNAYWPDDQEKAIATALREIFPASLMKQKEYVFEDTTLYGFEDYDRYLTKVYGADYMTPRKWTHLEDYTVVEINLPKK
jgi:hypothetical protein